MAVYRSTWLPPSETFVRDHVAGLRRYRAVALGSERHPSSLAVPGVETILAARPVHARLAARARDRHPGAFQRTQTAVLRDALRRIAPDVVHAHFGPGGARLLPACRDLGLPLVVTFHGYDVTTYEDHLRGTADGRLLLDAWPRLMGETDALITVSDYLRGHLLARGADPDRLRVIACGVQPSVGDWVPPPAGRRVLFVGRLVQKKGVADLVHAVARLPGRVPVDVVGDGPLRAELGTLAQRLGVEATFHGMASSDEVRRFMLASSIVAMPSQRATSGDTEGLPVTALEAGALGRPVVGYAHSGIVEAVLDEQTGLLAPEGDIPGLTDRLARVLADGDLAERLGRAGAEHVRTSFSSSRLLDRVERVYDEVLTRRAMTPPPTRARSTRPDGRPTRAIGRSPA